MTVTNFSSTRLCATACKFYDSMLVDEIGMRSQFRQALCATWVESILVGCCKISVDGVKVCCYVCDVLFLILLGRQASHLPFACGPNDVLHLFSWAPIPCMEAKASRIDTEELQSVCSQSCGALTMTAYLTWHLQTGAGGCAGTQFPL